MDEQSTPAVCDLTIGLSWCSLLAPLHAEAGEVLT